MKTSQQKKLYIGVVIAIIALIIGFMTWYLVSSRSSTQTSMMGESNISRLATLTGREFDEAYLADMLAHHESAVNMAEMIGPGTDREELRAFGQEIIEVQSQEMVQMRTWQDEWGFEETYGGHGSHSGMGGNEMAGHMMDMGESLMGLTGPEFEKAFLELMIEHHQQAIDMSVYAEENAERQEIKDLAASIMATQDAEINTMKKWLQAWGYADMYSNL